MRVVSEDEPLIEVYVSERQVAAFIPGQTVRFFPQFPTALSLTGEVVSVDKSPLKEFSRPVLASVYGGESW